MLQGLIPNISWQTWEQQSIWRKRCGWISHGRGVICGLQRLCWMLWQTVCANSQENTHFQHRTVGFIMVVKILPPALLVRLCQVCCDVSASTGKKLGERRGILMCFFSKLKPHSFSLMAKVILHSPGENRNAVTFRVSYAWNKACHFLARLVALKVLNLQLTTLHFPIYYLTGCPASANTETLLFLSTAWGKIFK